EHLDGEAQCFGDPAGGSENTWRAHDGSHRDQDALNVLERDTDIDRARRVQQVRGRWRVDGDERSDAGHHELARIEVALREGYGGHVGKRVEYGGFICHETLLLFCPSLGI